MPGTRRLDSWPQERLVRLWRVATVRAMGLVITMIALANPRRPDLPPVEVDALADSGSVFLSIPRRVQAELQLEELETRDVTLADGSKRWVPYVGPVQVTFRNRAGFFGAVVFGDQVLLGAIPME